MNERAARTASRGHNDCPNPACSRTKPTEKAFCLPCWRQLPHAVQRQVWASYRDQAAWRAAYPGCLYDHVDFLVRLGARLAAGVGEWPSPEPPVRACRVCGCTDDHACDGGCWWVEADLCSECAGVP